MIPTFDTCLVCDQIRAELNGKLIIFGYLGICPSVDITLTQLDQPTLLTFLISGHGGEGPHTASVDIVDDTDTVIAGVAGVPFEAQPNRRTDFGPAVLVVFGRAGVFAVRCIVDGAEQYRAHFRIRQGVLT